VSVSQAEPWRGVNNFAGICRIPHILLEIYPVWAWCLFGLIHSQCSKHKHDRLTIVPSQQVYLRGVLGPGVDSAMPAYAVNL